MKEHMTDSLSPDTDSTAAEDRVATSGRLMQAATLWAVVTAVFLVGIKFAAWIMTGSVALLGSLIDSVMDGFASTMNFFAVRHSLTPPDRDHRFGHGKAEALAGLGQFAFIAGSASFLALQSIDRLLHPVDLQQTSVGYAVMAISIAVTLVLVTFQRYVVKRTNSLAVGADELHYRSDLLMNAGVIVAIALSASGWFASSDAIFGLVISAWLGVSAARIMRRSYDELMDKEFDEVDRQTIRSLVMSCPDVTDFHDLRTRRSGLRTFIQLHLELDGDMKLMEAHKIADVVEAKIKSVFEDAEVIIHQDPAGYENPGRLARS
jgi:ferrous-iron efflux pump FieF